MALASLGNAQPRDCPGLTPRAGLWVLLSLPAAGFLQPLSERGRSGLEDALKEGGQSLRPDPWVAKACSPHGTCRVQGTQGNLCAESDLKMGISLAVLTQVVSSVSLS